jgi:hypothetical protein
LRWTLDGDQLALAFVDVSDGLEYNRRASEVILSPLTKVE